MHRAFLYPLSQVSLLKPALGGKNASLVLISEEEINESPVGSVLLGIIKLVISRAGP